MAQKQKQEQRYMDRDNANEIVMKEQGWVHRERDKGTGTVTRGKAQGQRDRDRGTGTGKVTDIQGQGQRQAKRDRNRGTGVGICRDSNIATLYIWSQTFPKDQNVPKFCGTVHFTAQGYQLHTSHQKCYQRVETFPRDKSANYLTPTFRDTYNEQVSQQGDYMFQRIETEVRQCFKAHNTFLSTSSQLYTFLLLGPGTTLG